MANEIFIIVGATASGKSALAMEYARAHNGVIINADALQQYTDLPVLTARPLDYQNIDHELYGFLSAQQTSSVNEWCEAAITIVNKALANRKTPIIVGGTGMYIHSLIHGLSPIPAIESAPFDYPDSTDILYLQLQKIDPIWAGKIQANDRQRIIRGLNVFHYTKKTLSQWHEIPAQPYLTLPYKLIHQECPPDKNREYIHTRLSQNFAQMQAEMAQFYSNNPDIPLDAPIFRVIGAPQLWALHKQEISQNQCFTDIYHLTCQYAKRQRTFIRNKLH